MRREQVERCLSTTMTIKDWCALNGVPESTLYSWMARFREEEPGLFGEPSASQWVEVTREAIAAKTALARADAAPAAVPAATAERAGAGHGAHAADGRMIVVSVNGAAVAVPAGSAEADVSVVLRAVAAL